MRFEAGATSARISDSLAVGDTLLYRLGAEAGQRMTASLEASDPQWPSPVYPPGVVPGDAATPIEGPGAPLARAVRQFDATLSASGEYMIAVSIKGAGAASAGTSDFTLEVAVTGALGETVSGDFADGLQGGPDRWRVRAAGGLNLRADPSIGAEVLMLMPDRTVVRNLGCRMAEARRWCQVARPSRAPRAGPRATTSSRLAGLGFARARPIRVPSRAPQGLAMSASIDRTSRSRTDDPSARSLSSSQPSIARQIASFSSTACKDSARTRAARSATASSSRCRSEVSTPAQIACSQVGSYSRAFLAEQRLDELEIVLQDAQIAWQRVDAGRHRARQPHVEHQVLNHDRVFPLMTTCT